MYQFVQYFDNQAVSFTPFFISAVIMLKTNTLFDVLWHHTYIIMVIGGYEAYTAGTHLKYASVI